MVWTHGACFHSKTSQYKSNQDIVHGLCPRAFAALHEMPYVLIAVNTENRSSQRVCEKLCGVRLGPLAIPPDNDRYLEGERTTYLYRFALPSGND